MLRPVQFKKNIEQEEAGEETEYFLSEEGVGVKSGGAWFYYTVLSIVLYYLCGVASVHYTVFQRVDYVKRVTVVLNSLGTNLDPAICWLCDLG